MKDLEDFRSNVQDQSKESCRLNQVDGDFFRKRMCSTEKETIQCKLKEKEKSSNSLTVLMTSKRINAEKDKLP